MVNPNLTDYQETYQSFNWVQAEADMGLGDKLNIAQAAVDTNCGRGLRDKVALLFWDGNREQALTFGELKVLSDRFALALIRRGVKTGDHVALFGRSSPEFYISLLGTIKAGAVAVPLFEGYMAEALNEILRDSGAAVLVTTAALKKRVNSSQLPRLQRLFVIGPTDAKTGAGEENWHKVIAEAAGTLETVTLDKDAPFAILYTSGSTGKPKGIILSHGGLVQYYQTGRWVMDFHPEDVNWCTADLGWVTGIAYGIFSTWLNGVTTAVYGGSFSPERWYNFIQRFGVTVWYTTPSALRQLMGAGDAVTKRFNLKTLRHILSVGEALNPAIIHWARGVFGLDVFDTWFMTETGAQIVANFRCLPIKPGSMGRPVPGIQVAVVDSQGKELGPMQMGQLAIRPPWPAIMRGIWKDETKYAEYFSNSWYLSGDLVYRDREGYY
ncbi:MAG: AMP-binding protein, partial [Firmicutes bacterium]|nr:AMP-binding protein [Bacillota bacterium]